MSRRRGGHPEPPAHGIPPDILYFYVSYRTPACRWHRRRRRSRYDRGMLTIPAIASSFGASSDRASRDPRRERKIVAEQGRIRWRLPRNKTSPQTFAGEELARDRAANAQAQRHPAGALRSRPRADDADQEHPRRSVLHHLPHRARGRSGRHRLRRLDGRHARRGADADLAVSRRWPTCWRRWRCPTRFR